MLLTIPGLLTGEELAHLRQTLATATWGDGRATAGYQGTLVKRNQQVAEDSPMALALGQIVLQALGRNAVFSSAALPLRVVPPLFNRYEAGMGFGDHIDNAIRTAANGRSAPLRTDLSATLFISDPADYDGGELVIDDTYGSHRVKLAAGDLVLYPASSVHRVEAVTRGARLASFFWVQSLVRDDGRRALLYDFDLAMGALRRRGLTGEPELVSLAGVYHNLMRQWAEV